MNRTPLAVLGVLSAASLAAIALPWATAVARAADEAKPVPPPPAVRVVSPLAVAADERVIVRLRGVRLAEATAVRLAGASPVEGLAIELKNKGNAEGDDALKKAAGDTQVEVELTLPTGPLPYEQLELVVATPAGDTATTSLRVLPADQLVSEAEPNGGFRQSQPVAPDRCTLRGEIGGEKDVDVFRLTGKAGQTLRAQAVASAKGSVLDASLALYDARGNVLLTVDDAAATPAPAPSPAVPAPAAADEDRSARDPVLEFKFPADGDYLLVVTDADDRSSAAATHPYLIELSRS